MQNIGADGLQKLIQSMIEGAGSSRGEAEQVSENLVKANLMGHDSHGVHLVPRYIENVKNKVLQPNAHITVEKDSGAILQLHGNMGYGQIIGAEAMELGIARAAETGVAIVALRYTHHLGRIGAWGEMCAEAGMVSIHYVNVIGHLPLVSPFGGAEARYGTNPYCTAIPSPHGGKPIVLDMATSKIAMGKVKVAYNRGVEVPEGSLINPNGAPTRDPGVMFREERGAQLSFGEHKGYGLALIAEILSGALVNGGTCLPENQTKNTIQNNMLTIIINPDSVGSESFFKRELGEITDYVKSARPAQGVDEVLVPGDPERISVVKRERDGIPLDDTTWGEIIDSAQTVGISVTSANKFVEILGSTPD